jgi:membrane protein implicated in regulation of membrane protease activity
MLTLYIVMAIVSGALILISAFGVDHGSGHDLDVGHDVAGGHDTNHDTDHDGGAWLPFLSLRFWNYFAAAFGLIGLLLTLLKATDSSTTLILALAGGLGTGLAVALIMRWLKAGSNTDGTAIHDLMGKEAKVIVGVKPDQIGKVRIEAKGELIDLLAVADDGHPIEAGEQVVVVGVDGGQARVSRVRDILGD